MHIANPIQVRGPIFLKRGAYRVTSPNGDAEMVTIITTASDAQRTGDRMAEKSQNVTDGWVEVQSSEGDGSISWRRGRSRNRASQSIVNRITARPSWTSSPDCTRSPRGSRGGTRMLRPPRTMTVGLLLASLKR